jgi:hypothetical protein
MESLPIGDVMSSLAASLVDVLTVPNGHDIGG